MALTLTSIFEIAAAFAIMIIISGWLKQDQHHDDGPMKPVRVPATYRKSRRSRQ